VWTEAVKPIGPVAYAIKVRCTLLRDIGAALSPFNAFLIIQGLETLALRMREHCKNAQAVVDFLWEGVKSIDPRNSRDPSRARGLAIWGQYGGLVGFGACGGRVP
jgi:O-acetylhomoserine (thiol)-lyase